MSECEVARKARSSRTRDSRKCQRPRHADTRRARSDRQPPDGTSCGASRTAPGSERVLDAGKRRTKLRHVPCEHARKAVTLDPLHTTGRVHVWSVVLCEESVTFQSARRHEDENSE